jgi:hypothetical protein
MHSLDIFYTAQNHQAIRVTRRNTYCHPILRAQIHAGHIDYVQCLTRMLLVVQLNGFLQPRERVKVVVFFQLLLAFAAGENELALPWSRVCFWFFCHPAQLDAGLP